MTTTKGGGFKVYNKFIFIIALLLGLFNGFSLIAQDSR